MPIPAIDRLRALSGTLLVIVFLAAICLPAADVFFDLDPTRLSEKRRLAPPPPVRLSQPLEVSYTAAFESWWNDNFGFRRSLVVGYSRALLALGVSPTPSGAFAISWSSRPTRRRSTPSSCPRASTACAR